MGLQAKVAGEATKVASEESYEKIALLGCPDT